MTESVSPKTDAEREKDAARRAAAERKRRQRAREAAAPTSSSFAPTGPCSSTRGRLPQKAGCPRDRLRAMILKELVDNALDAGDATATLRWRRPCRSRHLDRERRRPRPRPRQVLRLFAVNRPMVTTKLLRRPTRGAIGNGLRVVTGGAWPAAARSPSRAAAAATSWTSTAAPARRWSRGGRERGRGRHQGHGRLRARAAAPRRRRPAGAARHPLRRPGRRADAHAPGLVRRRRLRRAGRTPPSPAPPWPTSPACSASTSRPTGPSRRRTSRCFGRRRPGLPSSCRSAPTTSPAATPRRAGDGRRPGPGRGLGRGGALPALARARHRDPARQPLARRGPGLRPARQERADGASGAATSPTSSTASRRGLLRASSLAVTTPVVALTTEGKEPDLEPLWPAIEPALATAMRKALPGRDRLRREQRRHQGRRLRGHGGGLPTRPGAAAAGPKPGR